MKISMKKYVNEGEILPFGYATSHCDFQTNHLICYPVPFHLVMRFLDKLKWWYYKYVRRADWIETPYDQAYRAGLKRGEYNANMAKIRAVVHELIDDEIIVMSLDDIEHLVYEKLKENEDNTK